MVTKVALELDEVTRLANERLRELSAAEISDRPSPARWTIKQVIGHLIDSAANNHQRFVRAQQVADFSFPAYLQNEWVAQQNYDDYEWNEILNLWFSYNQLLAHVIRQVPSGLLSTKCTIGDSEPVTLEFLIVDYLNHLKHHLRKIAERVGSDWQFAE